MNRKETFNNLSGWSSIIGLPLTIIGLVQANQNTMSSLLHYMATNWVSFLGLSLIGFGTISSFVKDRNYTRRLNKLEDTITFNDQKEMDTEILHAVSWWIMTLNKPEEQEAYIHRYFPRNEKRILEYLNHINS